MNIEVIRKKNPGIEIKDLSSKAFKKYGRIISEYNFNEFIKYMEEKTKIPREGNVYVAGVPEMEATETKIKVEQELYGELPIQIGYCNGKNSTLNGLEYHKSNEINVAVTDFVLLLGSVQDIEGNEYEASKVEAFYIPKGVSMEIYGTTLHYAPCRTNEEGFKCLVILPKGTNLPLEELKDKNFEMKLLFAKNKWLLVHPSKKLLIEKGAHVGINGENLEVKF